MKSTEHIEDVRKLAKRIDSGNISPWQFYAAGIAQVIALAAVIYITR